VQSTRIHRRAVLAAVLAGITAAVPAAGPAFAADPTGSLSGVVRDTRGAVVPDAVVAAYLDPSGDPVQELQADAGGRFSLTGLKVGNYQVLIGLGGWSEWAPGRVADPGQAKSYQVRANRTTVADSVVTAAGIIAGRFLGPDGKPDANAGVNVTNVNTGSQHGGVTAADGTFRIPVQPDQNFLVSYSVGGFAQYVPHTFDPAQATSYFVRSGQTVRVNDQGIALSGMTGRVTCAAGAPAGGVYVSFINVDTTVESETNTKADGTYDFSGLLVPGRYRVRFSAPGGVQYAHQKLDYDSAEVITVTPGQTAVVDDQLLWVPTP
jgi:hypothetical protein